MKAPDADIYLHEMPGRAVHELAGAGPALGLMSRWPEICQMYAAVNEMLGDIVKVTPTSKSVGDLALFLVTNNLGTDAILDPSRELAFPESVVDLLAGRMGQPPGGFPPAVQQANSARSEGGRRAGPANRSRRPISPPPPRK